ncbi:MAG TPA: hypothetical protein VN947_29720 [Polyangia bacterium]|nr:hypothetical protein [Polyangia bacterium]
MLRVTALFLALLLPAVASAANGPVLQYLYGGNSGETLVFIHGKANCGRGAGGACGDNPVAYFTNGATGANALNEATIQYAGSGVRTAEAFAVGYDLENQGFWDATNDVVACLRDFLSGQNASGCNPNGYQRSRFRLVGHSAGATVLDRIFSSGWWPDIVAATDGYVLSVQGALAGARSASALYNVDGQGNWVTGFVSWIAGVLGWENRSTGAASLTRGAVLGEANNGFAGHSPVWFMKVTTTGGSCSANNSGSGGEFWCGTGVDEHDNDFELGAACASVGYSSDDDCDGILWMYDSDPTAFTDSSRNGGKYRSQYVGYYWHWFASWANHSHGRDDAYTTLGDWQNTSGCYTRSPLTCVGQFGL